MNHKVNIFHALGFGFSRVFQNAGVLLISGLILFFIIALLVVSLSFNYVFSALLTMDFWRTAIKCVIARGVCPEHLPMLSSAVMSVYLIAFIIIWTNFYNIGFKEIAFKIYDTGQSSVRDFFPPWITLLKVIMAIIIYAGVFALISVISGHTINERFVPIIGVILFVLAVRFYFYGYHLVDKRGAPFIQAFTISWLITRGNFMRLFALFCLYVPMALLFVAFIATPLLFIGMQFLYSGYLSIVGVLCMVMAASGVLLMLQVATFTSVYAYRIMSGAPLPAQE